MHFTKAGHRFLFFILSLVLWTAAGIYFTGTVSITDLIQFLSVPLVISWMIIFNPEIIRKNFTPYLVLTALITLMAAGYLIAFTQSIPHIKINWFELPLAVYFLLSVYTIIWLLDKIINTALSFVLRINNVTARSVIKGGVRAAFLIFVVVPYLVAAFTTHWIKFTGAESTQKIPGMEYEQVSFNADDGTKLDGWFVPSTAGLSESSVIIASGRSPTKNLYLSYAGVLSNSGYNVLLFDFRGNGDSSGHKYSFAVNEANDIICAINYLKTRYAASSRYIFGLGINEGAAALISAASKDGHLTAVVIDNVSGYEASLPDGLGDYLPKWLEKTLLSLTRTAITMDIGRGNWGTEKLYNDISQISPCPVLFTNGLKNDKEDRIRTIELYAKAKEPKMLWMTPMPTERMPDIGIEMEYFKNVLEIFDFGRAKRQSGNWRSSL